MGGLSDDFQRMERLRQQPQQPSAPPPQPVPRPAPAPAPQLPLDNLPEADPQPPMTRRSWYVTQAAATALADAVDEIHHVTRGVPKHIIASMMFELAATHADAIAQELGAKLQPRSTQDTRDTY
jgi:hypothetical protein